MKSRLLILAGLVVIAGMLAADAASAMRELSSSYATQLNAVSSHAPRATTSSYVPPQTGSSGSSTTPSSSISNSTMNWAGYAAVGGTYTSVSGSWQIPNITADTDPMAADATWIGIGGTTSDDLIQVGTENAVENGQVSGNTFYEQLPNTSETIPTVTVNPGDTVTASVKETSAGEWRIAIADLTNGETYANTVAYNSSESSAEWIEEAPTDGNAIMPLDNFGSVAFMNGSTTDNGKSMNIAHSNAQVLTMDNSEDQSLASVSSLNTSGNGFTVARTDASNGNDGSTMPNQYTQSPGGWGGHGGYGSGWGGYNTQSGYGDGSSGYQQPSSFYLNWQ